MKMPAISLLDWQKRFGTEEACLEELLRVRWPDGFICPVCGAREYSFITSRHSYQCSKCHRQTSATAGTIFHSTNLPLLKWFWAIYLCASDKGGISALRLSKQISVSWITAHRILHKLRTAMVHRDSIYRLEHLIEVDDAYIGGKNPGKRGRGAAGKTSILVAVEHHGKHAGFMATESIKNISKEIIHAFLLYHLKDGQHVRTDALTALNAVDELQKHHKKITPPKEASAWLPLVHMVIGNLKTFLNGTFHGVSRKYLPEYLAEFSYRFNRRFWEDELPMRLLNASLAHVPVQSLKIV